MMSLYLAGALSAVDIAAAAPEEQAKDADQVRAEQIAGVIQAALAQFRPQLLQSAIEQQYSRLGGLAGTGLNLTQNLITGGQSAASGVGASGGAMAANVGQLLGQQGAAQAGGILGQAAPWAQLAGMPAQIGGYMLGRGLFGGTGGGLSSAEQTQFGNILRGR